MGIANHIKSADWETEKHVPAIVLPETVKHGEPFDVEVSVGKEIPHPNPVEHHIAWIALHFVPDGSPVSVEIARADLSSHGPLAATGSTVKFSVCLQKGGVFYATSYCNLHGLWSSSAPITVG